MVLPAAAFLPLPGLLAPLARLCPLHFHGRQRSRSALGARMADDGGLSQRGVVSMTPVRDDLEEFFAAWSDPYHPCNNPEGYLVLLVAENKLAWDMLKRKLDSDSQQKRVEKWVAGYGDFRGEERFRAALSKMMENTFVKAPVDKECVMVQAGCGAVLDRHITFFSKTMLN